MRKVKIRESLLSYARGKLMDILRPEKFNDHMSRVSAEEFGRELKALDKRAAFIRKHFTELPRRATIDNAMIILGDRFGRHRKNVFGSFPPIADERTNAVRGFYSPETGRITAFGSVMEIPGNVLRRDEPFTILVDNGTGRIVFKDGRENLFLRELDGMRVF